MDGQTVAQERIFGIMRDNITQATSSPSNVAMVKMKSKMQSYNETSDWLRTHVWDCDACCRLANGMPAEPELLLRGVALE